MTVLALATVAGPSAAASGKRATGVEIGRVAVSAEAADGTVSLLVPVTYPIAFNGRSEGVMVEVEGSGTTPGTEKGVAGHVRLSAGAARAPERRRRFRFVYRVDLDPSLSGLVLAGARIGVQADGGLDVNGDGRDELSSFDLLRGTRPLTASTAPRVCSDPPQRRVAAGRRVVVRLPACTFAKRWKIAAQPEHGSARLVEGTLVYRPAAKFRGTDSLTLSGGAPVVFKVGSAQEAVVRAIGDSVTAGFGYYDGGEPMPLVNLLECKPGNVTLIDSCSSNSAVRSNGAEKLEYAPDYGLANDISWAAQWSNEHGITNYENLAISGSEPAQWAPGGPLYPTTKQVESEDPDYILMTIGANPLLDEMLFGIDDMGCAVYSDVFGNYAKCIEESFAEIHLHENLERLYRELVRNTSATIYLMQYHLSIPSTALAYSAVQIAEMAKMMNAEIAKVAGEVNPQRLQVVTPPHFNVGIDLSPVYPSSYSCSRFGYEVDGPSVQIKATQYELLLSHPLSFCKGPVTGPPWVISGDTGIHPSATGYTQMASQVPAPRGSS